MTEPSTRQLEQHIRRHAAHTRNIAITQHARLRMRQRRITDPMVLEALRMGRIALTPEPDPKFPGLRCRMQRFVAGVHVVVVVYVEYPEPGLTVVTVIDVSGG